MNARPQDELELSVVVPCFNEAQRLSPTLEALERGLDGRDHEVLLVDDGSTDATPCLLRDFARGRERFHVARLTRNRGKGRALAAGVAASSGRLVLITDADLSVPLSDLPRLEMVLRVGGDVAIASRAVAGAIEVGKPLHRQLMGKSFNQLVQFLLLPGVRDTQCGFKLFRGDVARELFAGLGTDGFAFDVEILFEARRRGLDVVEVPVLWQDSGGSRVHAVRHSAQMLRDLLLIRLRPRPKTPAPLP
ncbi:MAG: glycosyltransferase family 2 protein [Candidatus Dormibacteraeota bacterium]|nr:glycosyltransferase family 2 protein [Candidatus Dormibacteraeota bacterium]